MQILPQLYKHIVNMSNNYKDKILRLYTRIELNTKSTSQRIQELEQGKQQIEREDKQGIQQQGEKNKNKQSTVYEYRRCIKKYNIH